MTAQQILKADLLDILFENRNKEYGAYKLRREYPSHLKKALGLMLLLVLALFFYAMSKPRNVRSDGIPTHDTTTIVLENLVTKAPDKPLNEQPQRTIEKAPPTRENPAFKIVDDDQITKPISETPDTSGTAIGPTDSPGNGGEGTLVGTEAPQTIITSTIETEKAKEPDVYDPSGVSELPKFPGGDDAWLDYLRRMLRVPDELESGERKTVKVKFVVNADGVVTGAEIIQSGGAVFDREVLRVINRMPKWKPGKQRGKPVAVYFTQPVTFAGEEDAP